ncbi:MAG: helix-turn-helix domain-containing protein [Chthoniobacterales bacterium]|nr:helix-turn-helix domain-containing protein [Chthoniobacterales bacterium]
MRNRRIIHRTQALGSLLGIRQAVLADLSGVRIHSISDIESGKGNPTLDIADKHR